MSIENSVDAYLDDTRSYNERIDDVFSVALAQWAGNGRVSLPPNLAIDFKVDQSAGTEEVIVLNWLTKEAVELTRPCNSSAPPFCWSSDFLEYENEPLKALMNVYSLFNKRYQFVTEGGEVEKTDVISCEIFAHEILAHACIELDKPGKATPEDVDIRIENGTEQDENEIIVWGSSLRDPRIKESVERIMKHALEIDEFTLAAAILQDTELDTSGLV